MNAVTKTIHLPEPRGLSFFLEATDFDAMVDEGVDVLVIVTPSRRYVSAIDDWFDYGYHDLEGDVDVIVLNKSYMGA